MNAFNRLGKTFAGRLSLPLIAAPMFQVSGPELVIAACKAGIVGAFPTSNCRSIDELDDWLERIIAATSDNNTSQRFAPVCANLIIKQARLEEDLTCLMRHRIEMVITSVGSPAAVIKPLHDIDCKVFADVGSLEHAHKAVSAGVDGLIVLSAGAGGQTGWANPFAFISAVREFFDGPVVLAGGIGDGRALWGARALGYDLAYMGTRMIASKESMAKDTYKKMLVSSSLDDVMTTRAFSGLVTNILRPSLIAAGLNPQRLDEEVTPQQAAKVFGAKAPGVKRWTDIWSAGHSVSAVSEVLPVSEIVELTKTQFLAARSSSFLEDEGIH